VLKEAASKVDDDPLEAVAVSAMGDTLIPTDARFRPVGNAILAFDRRSQRQCDRLIDQLGFETIHSVTGMPAHPMATATKVLWMVESADQTGCTPAHFMCAEDFVIARLTGSPAMSYSTAARTMIFDSPSKQWWGDMLDRIGIGKDTLSSAVSSATVVGTASTHIADRLGLPRNMAVVTGGHDQICSAVGSGAVKDGMVSDNTGTFECVIAAVGDNRMATVDASILASNNLAYYPHGSRDVWAAFAWFNAGSALNWCRDSLFASERQQADANGTDEFELMFSEWDDKPTKVQFLPHLAGTGTPWLDPAAAVSRGAQNRPVGGA